LTVACPADELTTADCVSKEPAIADIVPAALAFEEL
jgi:hypothetical protein